MNSDKSVNSEKKAYRINMMLRNANESEGKCFPNDLNLELYNVDFEDKRNAIFIYCLLYMTISILFIVGILFEYT